MPVKAESKERRARRSTTELKLKREDVQANRASLKTCEFGRTGMRMQTFFWGCRDVRMCFHTFCVSYFEMTRAYCLSTAVALILKVDPNLQYKLATITTCSLVSPAAKVTSERKFSISRPIKLENQLCPRFFLNNSPRPVMQILQ